MCVSEELHDLSPRKQSRSNLIVKSTPWRIPLKDEL
jgi:hypothetical protein